MLTESRGKHDRERVQSERHVMQSRVRHHWPLKGTKITCTLHKTVQTAVLIETLTALGAEVLR